MTPASEAYDELCAYTLSHGGSDFLHQHVIDAFGAQHEPEQATPIQLTFALVGLYLHVEQGVSGRDVQRVHAALARRTRSWPRFNVPARRGDLTAADVLASPDGSERDAAIERWCAAVWNAYAESRGEVIALLEAHGMG